MEILEVKISSDVAYVFTNGLSRGKVINYQKAYKEWLLNRRIIKEISILYNVSYAKLTKEFDKIDVPEGL